MTLTDAEVSTGNAADTLNPGYVLDPWGHTMLYAYPGRDHTGDTPRGPDHSAAGVRRYDIASRGRNESWGGGDQDDLGNWNSQKVECPHYGAGDFP